jgi:predicted RecA/RadA family phage recombinase
MANSFNVINEGQQHIALANYTPSEDIAKGDVVIIGNKAMFADFGMKAGIPVSAAGFAFGGEYEFDIGDVEGANSSTAAGTAVYVKSGGNYLSLSSDGNTQFGIVTRNYTTTLWVKEF